MTTSPTTSEMLHLLKRNAAVAVGGTLAIFTAAAAVGLLLPLRYESMTKVRVVDNRALQDIYGARLAGAEDATERVRAIHEELLSRDNLLDLMEDLSLDAGLSGLAPRDQMVGRERLFRDLERATRVDLVETTRGQFIFRIAHRAPSPALAQRVVARLSTGYQERLYRAQKEVAGGALDEVRRKLGSLENEYRAAADELAVFEEAHAVHRLGQADDTRARHAAEEEHRDAAALELEAAEAQLADVRRRLSTEPEFVEVEEEETKEPVVSKIREEIRAAEEVLSSLREKWTDAHPDVQAQLRKIQQKRGALAEETARDRRRTRREPNPARVELAKAEWELLGAVDARRRILSDREARLGALKGLLPGFAERKKEWEALVDRKAALRTQMASLRDREESAKITWQVRSAENTLIFEVLDPPTNPLRPSSPDRLLICLAAAVIALGAGVGLAFAAEVLDGSCRTVEEAADATGSPVLGTIGTIETRRDRVLSRRRKVRRRVAGVLLFFTAAAAWVAQFAYGAQIHDLLSRFFG